MPQSLQSRKRKLVLDTIFDAAIDLFTQKGFEATTVEEVAEAAGVSRRSFFRYYASKDDLLARSVVIFGDILAAAVAKSPKDREPADVVRDTLLEALKHAEASPKTRQVIAIAERSPSAAQAHLSRMAEIEEKIAAAFAARMKGVKKGSTKPKLLAGLTTLIMSVAMIAWFHGEYADLTTAVNDVFENLSIYMAGGKIPPRRAAARKPARK